MKWPVAVNVDTGEWITPLHRDATRWSDEGVLCTDSSTMVPLVLRYREAKGRCRPHFATSSGGGGGEGDTHKAAKSILARYPNTLTFVYTCKRCDRLFTHIPKAASEELTGEEEFRVPTADSHVDVDVAIFGPNRVLRALVEVYHTHATGATKWRDLEKVFHTLHGSAFVEVKADDVIEAFAKSMQLHQSRGPFYMGVEESYRVRVHASRWTGTTCGCVEAVHRWHPACVVCRVFSNGQRHCSQCAKAASYAHAAKASAKRASRYAKAAIRAWPYARHVDNIIVMAAQQAAIAAHHANRVIIGIEYSVRVVAARINAARVAMHAAQIARQLTCAAEHSLRQLTCATAAFKAKHCTWLADHSTRLKLRKPVVTRKRKAGHFTFKSEHSTLKCTVYDCHVSASDNRHRYCFYHTTRCKKVGDDCIPFGKHKGSTYEYLIHNEGRYMQFMQRKCWSNYSPDSPYFEKNKLIGAYVANELRVFPPTALEKDTEDPDYEEY